MTFERLPSPKRKTMSVPEMRRLLGLKKTESYYLLKRGFFQWITVTQGRKSKMRVDLDSFEEWYRNQWHYRKVNGEEPGADLRKTYMRSMHLAEILGLSRSAAVSLFYSHGLFQKETIAGKTCIRVEDFENWYQAQTHYRKVEEKNGIHNQKEK